MGYLDGGYKSKNKNTNKRKKAIKIGLGITSYCGRRRAARQHGLMCRVNEDEAALHGAYNCKRCI